MKKILLRNLIVIVFLMQPTLFSMKESSQSYKTINLKENIYAPYVSRVLFLSPNIVIARQVTESVYQEIDSSLITNKDYANFDNDNYRYVSGYGMKKSSLTGLEHSVGLLLIGENINSSSVIKVYCK